LWARGAPYLEAHKMHGADLKSAPSRNDGNSLFFALGTPVLRLGGGFSMKIDSSVFVDKEENALFQAGGEFYLNGGGKSVNKLRFEWVGNSKTLAEYSQKSWFSEKYSIPARELNFNAYNLTFTNQYFAFSSDIAHSKAAFSGEDVYLNAALRGGLPAGSRFPLRLSRHRLKILAQQC
jgi:hypothetical protein